MRSSRWLKEYGYPWLFAVVFGLPLLAGGAWVGWHVFGLADALPSWLAVLVLWVAGVATWLVGLLALVFILAGVSRWRRRADGHFHRPT